jgi:hypothetical protein
MLRVRRVPPLLLGLLAFITLGCDKAPDLGVLELTLPEDQGKRVEVVVRSAFAEYVELPDLRNELRISLTSYETFCDPYRPPGPDDTRVTLTITTPPATKPGRGTYPWRGLSHPAAEEPKLDTPPGAVTGLVEPAAPPAPAPTAESAPPAGVSVAPEAMPHVRRGKHAHLFDPGGALELREVDLAPNGTITGLMAFEFPGDQKRTRTNLSGKFTARVCRSSIGASDR